VPAIGVYVQCYQGWDVDRSRRILLRRPASHWPPFFRRPWMATSIQDFWSVRWHQLLRHLFVMFGARSPSGSIGALLGRPPGAVIGRFRAGMWDSSSSCVSALFWRAHFNVRPGCPCEGGSVGCGPMAWTLLWDPLVIDSWVRRAFFAAVFVPDHLRLGIHQWCRLLIKQVRSDDSAICYVWPFSRSASTPAGDDL
jgi:hypothetical protein